MKRFGYMLLAAGLLASCQNELYHDDATAHESKQGVYINGDELAQIFLLEGASSEATGPRVSLVRAESQPTQVEFAVGTQADLEAYNRRNGTTYELLPASMYTFEPSVTIPAGQVSVDVPISLRNVQFQAGQVFALPIRLIGGGASAIGGQQDALIVVDQATETKVLRINTSNEIATYFAEDISVNQWTMEVMIYRENSINGALAGTKFVGPADDRSEIYPVLGSDGSFLRTGGTDLTLSKEMMPVEPGRWYMFSFVYDGTNVAVYSNGRQVFNQPVRDGAYKLGGYWLSTTRGLVRELRFYNVARTPAQIAANVWKMADPTDDTLVSYYPMNGKRYDHATGQITDDETAIWDWAKTPHHFTNLQGATFVQNGDQLYRFPVVTE